MSRPERGAYGNKRGKSVRQRQRARALDRRVQRSLTEAQEAQRRLDAQIAAQRASEPEQPPVGLPSTTPSSRGKADTQNRVVIDHDAQYKKDMAQLRENIEKRAYWPLWEARDLIRQGYSLAHTIRRTGWDREMLEDVEMGEW